MVFEPKISDITNRGHGLLAKVLAKVTPLDITAIRCGDGEFDGDIGMLEDIISYKLDGAIAKVTPQPNEHRTELVLRFTNENVKEFFQLHEIGIYALDPDEGEILYAYANYGERANFIEEFSGTWYTEDEITFYMYTASATNIKADIVKSSTAREIGYDNTVSALKATDVQAAIDEIVTLPLISYDIPQDQPIGHLWYEILPKPLGLKPQGVILLNAVVSDDEPAEQQDGGFWFKTGDNISLVLPNLSDGVSIKNAIVSETEPSTDYFWLKPM